MAKLTSSESFKNATIDTNDGTITEYLKDDTRVYKLTDILSQWNLIDGLSITIKQDKDLPASEDSEEKDD
ncbi:MAG: YonK family protein [Sphingobacteriaceae bacterium]|jgi:hypothetical protein